MRLTKTRLALTLAALVVVIPSIAVAISPFVDVAPGKFYEGPVNWAADNGITKGRDDTHFAPDDGVTRGESVTFLKRYDDNITQPAISAVDQRVTDLGQTIGGLPCGDTQVAKWDGTTSAWVCANDLNSITVNTDTLADLSCGTTQVGYYNGTSWACGNVSLTSTLTQGATTTLDSTGDVGWDTSVAIGADNNPIISYYDNTGFNLKAFHCADTSCTTGTSNTLDAGTTGNNGEFTAIAIGTDGFPIISYHYGAQADLKAYHCTDTACATGTATTLDTGGVGGFVGKHTSLAIGSDGFPAISYYDSVNGDLKAYHCTNTACTTGTATTLDTGGVPGSTVGRYTSIAIGTDNNPVIGYQDLTNTDLKAYHCTNRACTAGRSTTIDSSGDVGLYTSIAIGTDGLPVISYYENFIGDLKVTVVDVRITGVTFG